LISFCFNTTLAIKKALHNAGLNLNAIIALAALLVLAQPVVVLLAVLPVAGLKPAALPVALPTSLYLRFPVQMQAV